jgi:hypothetical protein
MFGLLDWIEIKREQMGRQKISKRPKIKIVENGSDELWLCFLPWHMNIKFAEKIGLFPKDKNLIVAWKFNCLMNEDPHETLKNLKSIEKRISREVKKFKGKKKMCVLGISLGNYPAVYMANRLKTEKMVLVAPGDKLGMCIFTGDKTKKLASKIIKRRCSIKSYDRVLKGTNPIENLKNLPTGNIFVHLAMWDRFIKTKEGIILIEEMTKLGKMPKVCKYHFLGHAETVLLFGLKNKLNFKLF